ncbi:tRNA1(Val) (adenine(37)-N6)-methyltransferase [Hufsiella ginkgonis]|nr:methyltransferase [Hufsiella ginkgonis]
MKINTDGVLLAAIAGQPAPKAILDIGTGTGVIALMLAQRFPGAVIDGVEIDQAAAQTAGSNFSRSVFGPRLRVFHDSFQAFLNRHGHLKYDLIVSNPPFFINSLKSPHAKINTAKHTGEIFFEELVAQCAAHLAAGGSAWFILPEGTAGPVKETAARYGLKPRHWIGVKSFGGHPVHRVIFSLGFDERTPIESEVVIYESPKNYSSAFGLLLKDFFTIF